MGVWQRVGQDLTAALIAVGLVLLTTYGASRVLIPAAPSPDDTEQTTSGRDPVAEVEALPESAAVIDASGFVEERLVLYYFVRSFQWSRPDGSSNDVDVKYQGSGAELTVLVRGITVGVPRTDRMTIVLTLDGKTFNAHPGDCTLIFTRFEYFASHADPTRLVPSFAAELQCSDLSALRSGETLSLIAAFDY
ncbi:MAG TPA: hypothetical protein DCY40_07000 [Actinobacteria bacterium]|nr:hypothetical protein [Actinomycetota bacterium]